MLSLTTAIQLQAHKLTDTHYLTYAAPDHFALVINLTPHLLEFLALSLNQYEVEDNGLDVTRDIRL